MVPWDGRATSNVGVRYTDSRLQLVIGRSYFGEVCAWPSKFYDGLNDAQRSVLEPPYANRLDRPNIRTDGTVEVTTRNDRKKQHDRNVFGTKYF